MSTTDITNSNATKKVLSQNLKTNLDEVCCGNILPKTESPPFYQTKYASNTTNIEYGGITQQITSSAMRKNYYERIQHIMNDTSNEVGLSAGGGHYIVPNYKFHENITINCEKSGLQTFKNAYYKDNKGSCKIHWEDY